MKNLIPCLIALTLVAASALLTGCCSHTPAAPQTTQAAPEGKEMAVGNSGPRNGQ